MIGEPSVVSTSLQFEFTSPLPLSAGNHFCCPIFLSIPASPPLHWTSSVLLTSSLAMAPHLFLSSCSFNLHHNQKYTRNQTQTQSPWPPARSTCVYWTLSPNRLFTSRLRVNGCHFVETIPGTKSANIFHRFHNMVVGARISRRKHVSVDGLGFVEEHPPQLLGGK